MSYWTFTDIFEEAEPPTTPFHGGFGLLNLQGIRKPTYHAFAFMKRLGNTILATEDSSCYVAKDAAGNVQILAWDYHLLSPDSAYNQTFYKKELPCFKAADLDLQLKNLKNGKYVLTIYRTGYQHNDPYTAYIKMERPIIYPDHRSSRSGNCLQENRKTAWRSQLLMVPFKKSWN